MIIKISIINLHELTKESRRTASAGIRSRGRLAFTAIRATGDSWHLPPYVGKTHYVCGYCAACRALTAGLLLSAEKFTDGFKRFGIVANYL